MDMDGAAGMEQIGAWRTQGCSEFMPWLKMELDAIECGFQDGLTVCGTYASLDHPQSLEAIFPHDSRRLLRWHILTRTSPVTWYLNLVEDYNDQPSERVVQHADYYRSARAYLLAYDIDSLEIGIAIDNEASFAPFLFSALALDMRVSVDLEVQFADIEGAPAPTYEGFWTRAEPMFVRSAPRFSVHPRAR
jgi:hypothetical protein